MKKVLSFVLVLAMILGCTSMAFATTANGTLKKDTDYVTPFEDAETSAVATILKDLGILDGTGSGKVELANTIDRASFCKILMVALGLADSVEQTATKFTDVPKEHWASGYIALANSLGYVDGTTATTFNPEGKVTANEAIAFVIKALGYQQKHLQGEWPQNYLTIALELGLLGKNYNFDSMNLKSGTTEVTREYAFTLLNRALDKKCVSWKDATVTEEAGWKTVLQAYGGSETTLLGKVLGTYGTTKVGSLYTTATTAALTAASAAAFKNFDNAENYIGQAVTILYLKTSSGNKAIGLAKDSSVTLEGKFADDTLVTFTAIDGTVYKLNAGVASAAAQIFNGGQIAATYDVTSNQAYTLEVTLDTDDASKIAAVASVAWDKISETYIVDATAAALLAADKYVSSSAYMTSKGITATLYTTNSGADLLDGFLTVEGAATKLADIQKGDLLEIYAATQEGVAYENKITKINVVRSVVTGKITNVDTINKTYTVNGTAYKFMKTAPKGGTTYDSVTINLTSEWSFTLDSSDKIAKVKLANEEEAEETPWNYAFVVKTGYTKASGATELDAENTATTYSIRLANFAGEEVVFSGLKAKVINTELLATTTDFSWASTAAAAPGKVVAYQLNGDAVTTMKAYAFATNTDITKITADGTDGKLFASDVKVVKFDSTASKTVTQVAYYAAKTVADVVGSYSAGLVNYKLNTAGKIDLMYIAGAATGESSETTFAAVLVGKGNDTTGTYASFLVAGEKKTVYCSTEQTDLFTTQVAFVTLQGGKLIAKASAEAITFGGAAATNTNLVKGYVYITTTTGLKINDGVVTLGAAASGSYAKNFATDTNFALKNASVIKWNATNKVYEKAEVADIVKATGNVVFIDLEGDKYVELVVVNYQGE